MAARELVGQLEDMVQCPVCLGELKEPRSLPCQHSFCTECLQGLLGTGRLIQCPCCKTEVPALHDVRQLPVDFRANSLKEAVSKFQKAREVDVGQQKEEAASSARRLESCETEEDGERCPVCEEILTVSKNLSCGHSLCGSCVQFLLPVGGDTLHCPTCYCQTTILPTANTDLHSPSLMGQQDYSSEEEPLYSNLLEVFEDRRFHQQLQAATSQRLDTETGADGPQSSAPSRSVQGRLPASIPEENPPEQSPLTFHPNSGKNVVVLSNHITAHIKETWDGSDAVVFTSRHLKPNELFEVRLDKKVTKLVDTIKIGVVTQYPTESVCLFNSKLSADAWSMAGSQSSSKVYHNNFRPIKEFGQNLNDLKVGDRVGVQRRANGDLHYYINGADLGEAAPDVPATVYGFIILCGKTGQVTITDTDENGTYSGQTMQETSSS